MIDDQNYYCLMCGKKNNSKVSISNGRFHALCFLGWVWKSLIKKITTKNPLNRKGVNNGR